MEELSLMEKFKILLDNISQHPLFIVLLLVPAIIFLLQKKHGKKVFVLVYFLVIGFVLYIGGEVIFELFDNLMNGLFMTLYFPNFITLFVVVVLCSIIALVSFFSKKMYRINKIINITGFAVIQMLFVLVLTVIRSNNIDIYADNALYTNSDVLTLMQILIGTFALQIVIILIINGINKVTDILDKRSTVLSKEISEQITDLKKTKSSLSLIKNIEIDNNKVGYINVADKKKTSKPLLKPFKFDLEKLHSITIAPLEVSLEKPLDDKIIEKAVDDNVIEKSLEKVIQPSKVKNKIKDTIKKIKPKNKNVLLPKERSKPINSLKPDLLKPMENTNRFIKSEIVNKHSESKLEEHSLDLITNLNILDIQSTLDTVIKYRLMKDVKLKVVDGLDAVDQLQIPNFDVLSLVLKKCKLYRKI